MMKTCTLFDKYRDGEISGIAKGEFEAHLAECADCRMKMFLLNNLAFVLKQDSAVMPLDLSGRIAKKAFQQNKNWDALVVGWLRPGPAFAALALVCVLFSALWLMPNYQPANASSEYQMLLNEANAITLDSSIQQVQSDTEFMLLLEREVRSQ